MIRLATPDDARDFARVVVAAQATWVEWAGASFEPYDEVALANGWALTLGMSATLALVATGPADSIVAVAAAGPEHASFRPSLSEPDSAHLSTLFALPMIHGAGVSQELHDRLLVALAEAGYRTVRLWVPEGAKRARRFYERNAWVATGAHTLFAGLRRVEMRRSL